MRIRILLFSVIALLIAFMTGCDEELDNKIFEDTEIRYFNLYLTANYGDSIEPIEEGLYYFPDSVGTGESPDTSDYVLINFMAYTIPDENVVDTYNEEWAQEHNIYNTSVLYGPYKFHLGSAIQGLSKGLEYMKEGGIARILFKSDLGYGAEGMGSLINGYESLMYDIQLLEVIDNVYGKELSLIADYLDTIDIDNVKLIIDEESQDSMYYIPDVIGEGDTIVADDELEIYYTGTLLDGRAFDSNIGAASGFDVTVGAGKVIAGWDLGLLEFRFGGSGRLLIPHQLAYGEDGNIVSGTDKYSIPPYEALLFQISVEEEVIPDDDED